MKTLAIVTYTERGSRYYFDVLQKIFGDDLNIKRYHISGGISERVIEADLVVVSGPDILKITQKHVTEQTKVIIANLTIHKAGFDKIMNLPVGEKALVLNTNISMCMELIEQFQQLGATHLEYIPNVTYYDIPGYINTAIIPGDQWAVPEGITEIVNIGIRQIDVSTLLFIALYFSLERVFENKSLMDYATDLMPMDFSSYFQKYESYSNFYESQILSYNAGIITYTYDGTIINHNNMALQLLNQMGKNIIGENVLYLFEQVEIRESIENMKPMQKKTFKINGTDVLIKLDVETPDTKGIGYLVIEKLQESRHSERRLRNTVIGKGYIAKYDFDSIITVSDEMLRLKRLAALNAETESSVLITGESGTGKELFAQAIHNASQRWDKPFVAINCAALPESLLESELFGYEEGAFTGAIKGGKKGIFELASGGTIFLDEIGEMPYHLQARLLRVLQEKEIMRIGGDSIIDVDIRAITATNVNINEQIVQGKFRSDLYYRLCVVPINIPPLRERKQDIPILIEHIKAQIGANYKISKDAMEALIHHRWQGNVRELRNNVEFLRNLRKTIIEPYDLPFASLNNVSSLNLTKAEIDDIKHFAEVYHEDLKAMRFILETLQRAQDSEKNIGRRGLYENAKERELQISEVKIRQLLQTLEEARFVNILKGRGGSVITQLGTKALGYYKHYEAVH
jgi:transcriptional regulator with PAS, ATPase and Fis domain